MTEDQKRFARQAKRKATAASPKALPEPYSVPEAKASKPTKGQGQKSPGTKVPTPMATRKSTADHGQESLGAKVPKPMTGPHPMATRRQRASGAGGLRSGSRLGPTDTCVDLFNPSKT
jgi:hypothetical protein